MVGEDAAAAAAMDGWIDGVLEFLLASRLIET